ncbi:MAG: DUF5050 domain-containing protein [Ignavibacteriales bacterium]|nr:DUF5050 domain-containing protein [Ignavibacteriales bacterium]
MVRLFSTIVVSATVLYAQVPTNGLVAYYPFNGNANDASGNSLNGTASTGVSWTSDRFGAANKATNLGTTSSIIEIADNSLLDLQNDFTISVWFRGSDFSYTPILLSKHQASRDVGTWALRVNSTRTPNLANWISSGVFNFLNGGAKFAVSSWQHVVFLFKKSDNSWSFYVNGSLDAQGTAAIVINNTSLSLRIGNENSPGGSSFVGDMDDIRIYNRSLAINEVDSLYHEGGWASGSLANTKFVFSSNAFDGANRYQIYKSNSDGSNWIRLTSNSAQESDPHWSPDGSKIVFYSNRDGNNEIYIMNADGTNQTRITNNAASDSSPAWSPDGTKIAFTSDRDGNNEIYVMNIDGTGQTRLTNNTASDGAASWSPNGSKIAFWTDRDGNGEIYVMNADGTGQTRLTNNTVPDWSPIAWSPNGTRISFSRGATGNHQVYIVNADGSGQTQLTTLGSANDHTTWSPDGTKIAFLSDRDHTDIYSLYTMNPDGSSQTRLTNNVPTTTIYVPQWSTFLGTSPAVPTLASPVNSATGVSTSPILSWGASSGATSYELQVSTNSSFSSTVLDQSGITATSYSVTGLSGGTQYYWRVNATNAAGTSAWSSTSSFTTIVTVSIPSPPALPGSPVDGATGVSVSPTLSWSASSGAVSYRLQVSTNSTFSSLAFDQSGITAATYPVTGLSNNTLYYWRVNATNTAGTSSWSSTWSFTIIPAIPPVPTTPSPGDGATNQSASPTLSWGVSAGATSYRLQVSLNSAFSTMVLDQSGITGTSYGVSGLSNIAQYYWRVNASNSAGTSAWSNAWSFTTIPSIPPPPTTPSPVDLAPNQSTSPTLSWGGSTGATSYRLQVSTTASFSTFIIDQNGLTTNSYSASGLSMGTTYYWRVSATNVAGTSSYSSVWTFSTGVIVSPPTTPTPADLSTGVSITPTLSWNASSGATSYHIQVSTSASFANLLFDQSGIAGTSFNASGLVNGTTYYWQVNATNSMGTSSWSKVWTFTTIPIIPPIPVGPTPVEGALNVLTNTTLGWVASAGAVTYRLQIATSASFASPVVDQTGLSSPSYTPIGLANSTLYYWRVNASNAGGTSIWSGPWSFTTIVAPPILTLLSPADGSTGTSVNPTLSWSSAAGATTYRLQVSTSSSFSPLVVDQAGLTATSYSVSGLSNSTLYYWRVNSSNAGGSGAWSALRSFTTIIAPPPTPVLTSPINGVSNQAIALSLVWGAASGASTYRLQVSTSQFFSTILTDVSGLTATSYDISGLAYATTYYWQVCATNAGGTSSWSLPSSFSTANIPLPAVVLSSPADGAQGQSTNPSFSWLSVNGATSYQLQVSSTSSFSTLVVDQSFLATPSFTVTGLSNGLTYYWRVRAANAGGPGPFSSTRSFVTIPLSPPAPLLNTPLDGAQKVSASPTLTWYAVSSAETYRVQVSTSSSFATTLVDQAGLTTTVYSASGLGYSTNYYWRVNATNAGGTGPWSANRSFTTNVAPPPTPSLASPATGSSDVALTPTLSWGAAASATAYRVQVSFSSNFASTVVDDSTLTGTSRQIGPLTNGATYYWRVSASNAGGWGANSTVWNFMTIPAPPLAPVLSSPSDVGTRISVNPTLTWNASAGATRYHVQLSISPTFGTTVLDDSAVTTTSKGVGPLGNSTTHYWRVSASNAGGSSSYSGIWSFTTVVPPPQAPTLLAPADVGSGISINPTLNWNASAGATKYHVQVSTSQTFGSLLIDDSTITATSKGVGPLANSTTYYWRVCALNDGGSSPYQAARSFTTIIQVPDVVSLTSPAGGVTEQPISLTLGWSQAPRAATYHLQLSVSSSFSPLLLDDSTIVNTSYQTPSLAANTVYYWRVGGVNAGGAGAWSISRSFTTVPILTVGPALISPQDNELNVSLSPTLSWNTLSGAVSYRLQVSATSDFATLILDQSGLTSPSRSVTGLANGAKYFWRVNASNSAGTSPYSGQRSFTTFFLPPAAPVISSPGSGSSNQPTTVTLTWSAPSTALTYHLQVSQNTAFAPTLVDDSTITSTSRQAGPLSFGGTYYWRVSASNTGGSSPYTQASSFSVVPAPAPSVSISTTISFPARSRAGDFTASDYHLIGLPGSTAIPVASVLSGTQKKDWQVYWDNGNASNYLVEYVAGNQFQFGSGKAFWVVSKSSLTINQSVTFPTLNSSGNFEIPLQPSWNLITNPFNSSIPWSRIQSANNTTASIFAFNGSFGSPSVNFDPYVGYYYFNGSPGTTLPVLKIPYTALFGNLAGPIGPTYDGWKVAMSLSSEGSSEQSLAEASFGVSVGAANGMDAFDMRKPRAVAQTSGLYFDRPDWDALYSTFGSDIRPVINRIEKWDFKVNAEPLRPSRLIFRGLADVPMSNEVYLVDAANCISANLRLDSVYSFVSPLRELQFSVFVGSTDAVLARIVQALPTEYELSNNFPNPFNPTTSLRLSLPERSMVHLAIYNILGQKIRSLRTGTLTAGNHWITWDGKNDQGAIAPSGVYYCRLNIEGRQSIVRRMVLLK